MICKIENKRQFINEAAAHEARRATASQNIKIGKIGPSARVLNIYKCKHCGFFHVGHTARFMMNKP